MAKNFSTKLQKWFNGESFQQMRLKQLKNEYGGKN